jgi:hypothetical protein
VSVVPLTFLALYVAGMVWLQRDLLFTPGLLPQGDLAADDLLIWKAKHFALLHGNYSRVGFYHPGPFFLQVGALGESLFFDALGLFANPYGAAVFAVTLLHGVALALALRLWLVITRDTLLALVCVAVLIATIVFSWDRIVFAVPWNPHSYVAGAVLFSVGLLGVAWAGAAWAPLAALGAIALIHGHASFIGLIPASLLAFTAVLVVVRVPRMASLSWRALAEWISRSRVALGLTLAILVLGVWPIVANTLLHWPGELPKYFGQAGRAGANGLGPALAYEFTFVPLLGIWLLVFLVRPPTRPIATAGPAALDLPTAAYAVLAAGLAPALWYAIKGVDDLNYRYLLLWLEPFVGIAAGAALVHFLGLLTARSAKAVALIVVAFLCLSPLIHARGPDVDRVGSQDLAAAAKAFEAITPPGTRTELVLEKDPSSWATIWSEAVSVAAVLNRDHRPVICISPQTWELLFSAEFRCDPQRDQIARVLLLVPKSQARGPGVVRLHDTVAVAPTATPLDQWIEAKDFLGSGVSLGSGWSTPEPAAVWSDGAEPSLAIQTAGLPGALRVTVEGSVFSDGQRPQRVYFLDGSGRPLATLVALGGPSSVSFNLPRRPPDLAEIHLRIERPMSPLSLGQSGDPRKLGFALKRLRLTSGP